MFERFTQDAREVVVGAQKEALRLHAERIGTEHLLLALVGRAGTTTYGVLSRHGLTHERVAQSVGRGDMDAEALTTLGIDLDAVRSTVEASFGPGALDSPDPGRRSGHLPFTPRAKKVLELSLRETVALKQTAITEGHIALGLLREGDGRAMKVLADLGVDPEELRKDVRTALLA